MAKNKPKPERRLWPFVVLALSIAIAIVLLVNSRVGNRVTPGQTPSWVGGDFTLQSAKGPVSLSDFKGKVVLLYFGYASCPDICPTSLGILSGALRQLDEAQRQQIQPIFISVDPGRDTPEHLETYANHFYPGMIGLTGTKEQIDKVTFQYRTMYEIVPLEDSALGYSVSHSSIIYVIDRDGAVNTMIQHGTPIPEVADKIRQAL